MDNNYTKKSPNNRAPFVYELYFLTYVNIFYLSDCQSRISRYLFNPACGCQATVRPTASDQ